MTGIQILLVVVVVGLSFLMFVVGVQVIMIIIDLRQALKRLNNILEDSILGGGLIRPEKLTGIIELFRKNKKLEKKEYGKVEQMEHNDKSND